MENKLFIYLSVLCVFFLATGCVKTKNLYEEEPNEKPKEPTENHSGKLISFKFEKAYNPQLEKDINMKIYGNGNITGYLSHEADLSSLKATFVVEYGEMYVANTLQTSKTTTNDYTKSINFELLGEDEKTQKFTVNLLPFTGLPVVVLHTENEKFPTNKEDWLPTLMEIDGMGTFENYTGNVSVRGRGNATWKFPKKAFNMKMENKDPILGMPKHKRWSFLANWRDRTLLRNKVTFHIGEIADNLEWTPRSQFVEVIFDGVHKGNYQVTEHVRVDKNRVNVKEVESTEIDAESITGGYLLELDNYFDEINKFRTSLYNLPVNFKSPDEEILTDTHKKYVESYFNTIEEALKSKDYATVFEHIDMNSFIDFWMVNALVGNSEIKTPFSVFCYKDRGKKLFAGPLWDFDLSTFATTEKSFAGRSNLHFSSWWYADLFKDPTFAAATKKRFYQLKPAFLKVPEYIESQGNYLSKSEELNWKLWKINPNVLYVNLNGDETFEFYQDAIDRMIEKYLGRLELLENEIRTRFK